MPIDYSKAPAPRPIPPPVQLGPATKQIDYTNAPPQVQIPDLNSGMKKTINYGIEKAKNFGDWATTSVMPDAEEGVADLAGKIPYVGDYAKPVAKFIVGGMTSPAGLATLGVGSKLYSGYKKAKALAGLAEGPLTAEQALVAEIQGARPIRNATDKLRSIELGKRSAKAEQAFQAAKGEGGAYMAMGELKGELPKVDFESIAPKFTQDNIDAFYDKITKSKRLTPLDKASAIDGLKKVFGEGGGQVPQTSEINLLTREFGPEFAKALESKNPHKILDAAGIPRTIMASGDLSFPMRQNVSNISRAEFWKNLPVLIKAAPEAGQKALWSHIKSNPHYDLALKSGVDLSDYVKEEGFASKVAHHYPGVQLSENSFSGYGKEMRMDLFAELVEKLKKGGNLFQNKPIDLYQDDHLARELGKFVNTSSGRSQLKFKVPGFPEVNLENSAKFLNTTLFSPRLAASRIKMFSAIFDSRTPNVIRKEYIRNALGYMGAQGAILTTAALAGKEVVTDITNPDFAKVKIGNTRLDFSGGVNPYVRLLGQLAYGQKTSSVSGKRTILGQGYKAETANDLIGSFITQKTAPLPSVALDIGRGWKDSVGQPVTLSSEAIKLTTPIVTQDINDILKDDPNNLPYIAPAIFGVGINTYGESNIAKQPKKKSYTVTIPGVKVKR